MSDQSVPERKYSADKKNSRVWVVVGILALAFILIIVFVIIPWLTDSPVPLIGTVPGMPHIPVGGTGDSASGTGTGLQAGSESGAGGAGGGTGAGGVGGGTGAGGVGGGTGAGGAGGGTGAGGAGGESDAVFTPPGDDPASNPALDSTPTGDGASAGTSYGSTKPVSIDKIKMARLYTDTDFTGEDMPLLPGMSTILATVSDDKYVFTWKSMKIETGTKIMFTRETPSGNIYHSFAVGQFNVNDLEKWVRTYDRISGEGNWGYGSLTIDRLGTYGKNPIYIKILNDDEWVKEIKKEQASCIRTMHAWGGAEDGYPDSKCDPVNDTTFRGIYTISI